MARLPTLRPSLTDYVVEQTRQAQRQASSSAFARSGTSVTAEDEVTVDGAFIVNGPLAVTQTADITGTTHIGGATDIDGTLNVDAATTIGGTLGVHGTAAFDGATTIGGNAAITGTLSLPAGIIDNAALANPTKGQKVYDIAQNFGLSTTLTTRLTTTITVPAGFTTADVSVIARVYAINQNTTGGSNGAGADFLNVRPSIASFDGFGLQLATGGGGGSNINVAPVATVLTGLTPGSTFNITVKVVTMFLTWTANSDNTVITSGLISWGR